MSIQTRYIEHVGTIAYLRIYWREQVPCPNGSYHNAQREIARSNILFDNKLEGEVSDHIEDPRWPLQCEWCGKLVPPKNSGDNLSYLNYQVFRQKLYNNQSGKPEPGDLFFLDYKAMREDHPHHCHSAWTNCDGKHLQCILPNGEQWDIDSRASNCTKPEDRTHRCWVRHGDPTKGEVIHVDKNGNTCNAGAGSIIVDGWHGFLHQGILRKC